MGLGTVGEGRNVAQGWESLSAPIVRESRVGNHAAVCAVLKWAKRNKVDIITIKDVLDALAVDLGDALDTSRTLRTIP
jgi:hypothetical protein